CKSNRQSRLLLWFTRCRAPGLSGLLERQMSIDCGLTEQLAWWRSYGAWPCTCVHTVADPDGVLWRDVPLG
ncbi:hypothetical protein, partial [Kribbella sp. NPDC051620]|uniref:hypothetical protein n=1 Tax=Kribbella sp. NPDC051620 TaxID=3364120 RepID=UPI0037A2500D